MKSREIAQRRMHTQRLRGAPFETLQDVVRWLGAIQSQEFQVAKWSVGQRAEGVDNAAMDQAYADGAILRTHVLRPTWHFVLPADIRWMLDLTAPRVKARMALYDRRLELDDKLFAKTNALLAAALKGGKRLTRKELAAILDRAGIPATGQRLGHIMMRAELDAVVCSGGLRGKQHTYALLDDRTPRARALERDEALAELTRRYFTSRGPATVKDYLWWSSLTAAEGRSGLDMVASELEREVIDGRTYWFAPSSSAPRAAKNVIDLVQGYDECIVAYTESKDVLFAALPKDAVRGDRPVFTHAVLLDGHLIGHWRPVAKRDSAAIETFFYRPLTRDESRSLDAAVERYGAFLAVQVVLAAAG
jgi:hypothetical protein